MNYKDILRVFSFEGSSASLTARRLSTILIGSLNRTDSDNPEFLRSFSVKRISGDLDRLFRMGFVSRKRVKRIVVSKQGISIAKGFEYEYRISSQGRQYLSYLDHGKNEKQKPFLDQVQDATRQAITDDLYQKESEALAKYLSGAYADRAFEDRGRHNRFPAARHRVLADALKECQENLRRKELEILKLKATIRLFSTATGRL